MGQPVVAIVNPAAGGGRAGKMAGEALARLRGQGVELQEVRTEGPGDATTLAREAWGRGVRGFISVGGDGTAYEVVNGLLPEALSAAPSERPWLGMLPLGTGNSFLRDFTDEGAAYAAAAIVEGRRRPCDVVRMTCRNSERYYINILSIGFTAAVGATANRRFKALGPAGYAAAVVSETIGLSTQPFRMKLDGEDWNQFGLFVSFCNSRYTGGQMMMAPYADTADGKLDVVLAAEMGRAELLSVFPKIFKGSHVHLPKVTCSQARVVDLWWDEPTELMIDGEIVRDLPVKLEVLPGAIEICA